MVRRLNGYMIVLVFLVGGTALSAEKLPSDPRLSEKVTVDCTNTRLYKALGSISTQTKVKISAGRNEQEWTVRDLPVLVCSRDLPLSVLLQSIADANHLLLTPTRKQGKWAYQIWRDPKREVEMAASDEARREAALAAATWDWDALCRVKDIPYDALPAKQRDSERYIRTKALSNIVSQLGIQARDKVLSGDMILLGLANSPEMLKPYLMDAFKSLQADVENSPGETTPPSLDEIIDYCHITLRFGRWLEYPDHLYAEVALRGVMTQVHPMEFERYWSDKLGSDYIKRPVVSQPKLVSDLLGPQYEKLVFKKGMADQFLDTKVKIPKSEAAKTLAGANMQSDEGLSMLMGGRGPSYADLLSEVSRATGYSIVAEGQAARYEGTVLSMIKDLAAMFGRETTVREALEFIVGIADLDWYLDREHKLLIGRDREWMERLNHLVSEKLLVDLQRKMKGPGIELDDIEPLTSLTRDQFRFWIAYCPEFPAIEQLYRATMTIQGDSVWKLYFMLTPADRSRLKAGELVFLSAYDQASVASIVNACVQDRVQMLVANAHQVPQPWMTRGDLFADENASPVVSVRLQKDTVPKQSTSIYHLHMHLQMEGEPEVDWQDFIGPFPFKPKASAKQ